MTLEDRTERQRCAETIIETMSFVSTKNKERDDYKQVLWDHLYIMSGFKLDIDFPYEVTTEEEYTNHQICGLDNDHQQRPAYRHYGRIVERMIQATLAEPEGEKRDALAYETALQMKRSYVLWNKDSVANAKIFADLYELSKGMIYLDEVTCQLPEAKDIIQSAPQQNNNQRNKRINISRRRRR